MAGRRRRWQAWPGGPSSDGDRRRRPGGARDVGPGGLRGHGRSGAGSSARGRPPAIVLVSAVTGGAGGGRDARRPPQRPRGPGGPAALDRAVSTKRWQGSHQASPTGGSTPRGRAARPGACWSRRVSRPRHAPGGGLVVPSTQEDRRRSSWSSGARCGPRHLRPPCRPDLQGRWIRTGDPPRPPPGAGWRQPSSYCTRWARGRAGATGPATPRSTQRPRPDGDEAAARQWGSGAADHGRRPRDVRQVGPPHSSVEAGRDPR
jgi:hypothetical protein